MQYLIFFLHYTEQQQQLFDFDVDLGLFPVYQIMSGLSNGFLNYI